MDSINLQQCIALNVKELRKEHGLTQEMLAEKSHLTSRQICRVENMENLPNLRTLNKLAKALSVDITTLYRDTALTE